MGLMSEMSVTVIDHITAAFGPAIVAIVAGLVAIGVRTLLRQYSLRLVDERVRLDSAIRALADQKEKLRILLENQHVPNSIKVVLLDVSSLIGDRDFAHRVNDWALEEGQFSKTDRDSTSLDRILNGRYEILERLRIAKPAFECLRVAEPKLFEDVNGAIRGAFVTMMLQWPETNKGLRKIAHRFATESASQTFAWAVEERRPQLRVASRR